MNRLIKQTRGLFRFLMCFPLLADDDEEEEDV